MKIWSRCWNKQIRIHRSAKVRPAASTTLERFIQNRYFPVDSPGPGRYNRRRSGCCQFRAQVAQLVEQRTENPRVGGSNPPLGTIILSHHVLTHCN